MSSLSILPVNTPVSSGFGASSVLSTSANERVSVLKDQSSEQQSFSAKPTQGKVSGIEGVESQKKESANKEQSSVDVEAVIAQLQQRDQEVRAHEMAHLSAAGGLATGGMKLTYQTGPDGKQYAIGGEVGIKVAPGKTPEETIQKAQKIQQAALAPAEPSPQDLSVAQAAMQMQMQAQQELASQQQDGVSENENDREVFQQATEKASVQESTPSPLAPEESSQKGEAQKGNTTLMPQQAQFLTRLALQR